MISAGVDLGLEAVKVVVMKDSQILARSMALSGGSGRGRSAEHLWQEVVTSAGLSPSDVNKVVATGQGKYDVKFANDHIVEAVADVRAALWLYPSAKSVVDVGADQARAAMFDANGNTLDNVLNQKCTAGIGIFLRSMARTLGMTLDEMGRLSCKSQNRVSVSDSCWVFAELDVISLIHENAPKEDIVQAINEAVATRLNSLLNEKRSMEKDVVLIGGVARNSGVVNALKKRSGIDFLIPEQPEFGCALGAAIIAATGN